MTLPIILLIAFISLCSCSSQSLLDLGQVIEIHEAVNILNNFRVKPVTSDRILRSRTAVTDPNSTPEPALAPEPIISSSPKRKIIICKYPGCGRDFGGKQYFDFHFVTKHKDSKKPPECYMKEIKHFTK